MLRVRIIGIQAMELTSYRAAQRAGDCHAVDATRRLEQLVKRSKGKIRVSVALPREPLARPPAALDRGPPRRALARRRPDPRLRGPRAVVARARRGRLQRPLQPARRRRRRPRTRASSPPTRCGIGPNEGHPIGLWAQWDADGNDRDDVNGEYVKIRNYDVNQLAARSSGWYLRDSGLRRFTFPPGSAIPPNSSVTVYAGMGEDAGTDFYWGLAAPVFENATRDNPDIGDGAYLFDPQGDIRASMIYPCKVACSNPAKGRSR